MKPPRPQTQVPAFKPILDMKLIFVLVAFYVFVLLLLAGTSYLVFILKVMPDWWFFPVFSLILVCKPKIVNILTTKSDGE